MERRGLSPSPPENRNTRPPSVIRPPGKQIIPADSISSNKTLGEGEFGVVQQGIWTTETGEKVNNEIKKFSKTARWAELGNESNDQNRMSFHSL